MAAHQNTIIELVDAAAGRGAVLPQDREDAIASATLRAYELAQRYDAERGPFEHQLRYVLSRELAGGRSTDALDHSTSELDEVAPERIAIPNPVVAEPEDLESRVLEDIHARIARLPSGRYRVLARLAYVEGHTIGIISRRTGLHRWYLKKHLTIISRLLSKG